MTDNMSCYSCEHYQMSESGNLMQPMECNLDHETIRMATDCPDFERYAGAEND